jgi:transcriptional regulator with XRE-family HTH domain
MTQEINYSAPKKVDAVDKHVGKKIKNRRIMLGMSQQELGEAVNVSIQQIQKYEKATNRVSSGKLYNFASYLNVPILYFFEGYESNDAKDPVKDSESAYDEEDKVPERELLNLIKAFNEIEEPSVRKKIIELTRSISGL